MSDNEVSHSPPLRVGAARVDITPKAGTHLGGTWGTLRPAETIGDRLYTRAIVIESAGKRVCIAAPDLELIVGKYTRRIREAAEKRCGLAPDEVMVHLAQAHSAPPLGNFLIDEDFPNIPPEHEYLRGAQSEYCDWATDKIVESIERACARMVPVQMSAGSAVRDDLAFNRRGVMRDGKVTMPWFYPGAAKPLGPTEIRYLEGPTDPEVGVVAFRDEQMRMVAMLLHHTCHPVNLFATTPHVVSPDWPGTWASGMQQRFGEACVPIVLNGCCGNINPWPAFAADFKPDHRRQGEELAKTGAKIMETLRFEDFKGPLASRVRNIALPIKQASAEALAKARRYIDEHPQVEWQKENPKQATWEWMDAAMVLSVELERLRTGGNFDYEIQVFRVGDIALIGLPGEPFVEGQLEIKIGSPAKQTYVAHGTYDYAGYIAPRASYARGGHEIRDLPAKWTKLAQGSLESIVEASVETVRKCFADS